MSRKMAAVVMSVAAAMVIVGIMPAHVLEVNAQVEESNSLAENSNNSAANLVEDDIIITHAVPYVLTMKGMMSWHMRYPPDKIPLDMVGGGPIPIHINITGFMYCNNQYAESGAPFSQIWNGRHGHIEFFYTIEGHDYQRGYLARINPIIKNDTIELTANYISIYEDPNQSIFTMSVSQGQIQSVIKLTEPITCEQNLEHGPHPTQDHYNAKVNSSYVNVNTTYGAYFNPEYETKPLISNYSHFGRAVQTESFKEDSQGYGRGFDFNIDFPNEHDGGPVAYLDGRGWIAFREQQPAEENHQNGTSFYNVTANNKTFMIDYSLSGGEVDITEIEYDPNVRSMYVSLVTQEDSQLVLKMPTELAEQMFPDEDEADFDLTAFVDGVNVTESHHVEIYEDSVVFYIPLEAGAEDLEIIGAGPA